jgi:flagellar motor protein MotB
MKLKKKKKTNNGAPKWMTTYADMITLVLVFFRAPFFNVTNKLSQI